LFWWGDKIIIGSMLGFAILGSYLLATQFVGLLYTIPVALGVYLLPQEAQGISNKKLKIYSVAGICFIILFSIMIIPSIINNFFVHYLDSILPIQIMLIGIIPLTILTIFESMLLGKEKSNHILYGTAMQTGAFFILLISFGNKLGLIEIAIFFLLSIIIKTIYISIITKFKIL